jgi:uncharacterized membrane protein YfcA
MFIDHIQEYLVVLVAGLIGGTMNAAAGGGSFVTVPAMIAVGIPSVSANMSSTIALFPGALVSGWAYRHNFPKVPGINILPLVITMLIGGFFGALLLIYTPSSAFDKALPWLLLFGALVFAFGKTITDKIKGNFVIGMKTLYVLHALLGIYGGYFGGAVGIMTMATWTLLGAVDIRSMNALKVVLVAAANSTACVLFAFSGLVWWVDTLVMLVGTTAGGIAGAQLALRVNPKHLRTGIVVMNFVITAVFFYKKYMG